MTCRVYIHHNAVYCRPLRHTQVYQIAINAVTTIQSCGFELANCWIFIVLITMWGISYGEESVVAEEDLALQDGAQLIQLLTTLFFDLILTSPRHPLELLGLILGHPGRTLARFGRQRPPKWAQRPPKWAQRLPKWAQRLPKWAQRPPKWAQRPPKWAPRALQVEKRRKIIQKDDKK